MAFPKQSEIVIPLLRAIDSLGGQARPQDVYPLVAKSFPDLTEEDQNQRLQSSPTTRKWWNLVQWVRQSLVENGEIDGSERGVWKLTETGRAHLQIKDGKRKEQASKSAPTFSSLYDLVNDSTNRIKTRIVDELNSLAPHDFEKFCVSLLSQLGYEGLEVTKETGDGGIDGFGNFRQGVVSIKSAFQAKRWKNNPVGRPEIDAFRGAIQGDYDHGVFITTSRFTKEAQEASVKKGAISILLLDGDGIASLMVEKGLGVRKEPIYLLELDDAFFDFE